MRLFCRDPHDKPDQCPPHRFEGGWQMNSDDSPAILYCRYCGDVRLAAPPSVEMPVEEMIEVSADAA